MVCAPHSPGQSGNTHLQPQESQEVAHPKRSERDLQEFHSFVTPSIPRSAPGLVLSFSRSPPPLYVVCFCFALSPPQAVPVDSLAHICVSPSPPSMFLSSLSRYRFPLISVCCSALSHSMLYLSFLLSLLLFVFPPSPLSVALCSPSSPSLLSLSLFSVAPSLASLLWFLTTFCLHPYLSFFLYLISRPLLLPSLYLYVLIYYVLPYFSFLLHLLAIFSSRGLSLSLPTSLKYHSSRKRPTCSRGYLRSPCSPTSLLLSMGM